MEELPEFVHVIDDLNKEYSKLEEENNQLKKQGMLNLFNNNTSSL